MSSASTRPNDFSSGTFSTDEGHVCHERQRMEMAFSKVWSWRKTFLSLDSLRALHWPEELNVYELPFLIALDMFGNDDEPISLDEAT